MLRPTRRFDVTFYAPWFGPLIQPGVEPPPGGAETQMLLLARGLVRRGYSVCFITLDTERGLPAEVDGIAVRTMRRWRPRPGLVRVRYLLSLLTTLVLSRSRVVVQRAASAETGLVALVARVLGRRFVYSSANVVDFSFERLEASRRNVWLFHLGVRLAGRVVVQTGEQVALCRERFRREPVLIKSVAEVSPVTSRNGEAFLWVGRLAPYKRPEEFLALAEALPHAQFWMLAVDSGGFGSELGRRLRARASELGNVEWLQPRPREQLLELMQSAVAIVNTAEYEGMPNIFLEAWARGVPALSLYHDPDGVIGREGLGLFAEGDRELFAQQAQLVWHEPERRALMGQRGRDYIGREHHPDRVLDAWVQTLELPAADS